MLRERSFKKLKEDKQELKKQLARLGIQTLRPVDVAWDYVISYNEEIRQLWSGCNKKDHDEKGRVMRQIADLDHKREQRLAEVDQLPDCPIKTWEFQGWVDSEYREALRPLEKTGPVEEPEPVEHTKTLEQPELVVTQPASKNIGFLDHVSGGSEPIGDYHVPKVDLEPMDSIELGGKTTFDAAFENAASSQKYDADRPSLDAFEQSLFATQSQFESGEVIEDDDDSLFGDPGDYQHDPAPVSCQAVEEVQPPENASHASPTTQQASLDLKVIDKNDSDSVYSMPNGGSQPEPAAAPSQAAEKPLVCDNTIANVSVNEQVSQEQQAVEGYTEDSDSLFGGEDEETDGPVAEPEHGTEIQLGPGVEALPTQEPGTPFDQGLGAGLQMPEQPGLNNQAAPGVEPAGQVVPAPQEVQQRAAQSEATGQGWPPPYVSGKLPDAYVPLYRDLAKIIKPDGLEKLRRHGREDLRRFWPYGRQDCSDLQLDLYSTGVIEFKQDELERYERCFGVGKPYVVEFEEEYEEIPPNKTLEKVFNGIALFHCLVDNQPEVVDLTEDHSISSATAAPLDVPEPTLAAPAEIVPAGEPVPATADGDVFFEGDEASEQADLAPKKVGKITTPPPVDQTTFTQGAIPFPGNTDVVTPVPNDAVGNNGTWSSGWSGEAFSSGGEPPKTPSNREVVVMERSVSTDNTKRKTSTTDKAVVTKKTRANARAGAGSGSLSSTQSAHVALQGQLSQTAQTAGNVHAPAPAAPGPVAGPSTGETTERGNKRRKKNAQAAADPDASRRQQHSTPEQQPAQYYGPSPEQRVDAKKWVEDHTQGGKGKKGQKRKTPEPKKTPTPRKAQKTKEATPTAPRTYRNIAPAPARNHDDANDVQMRSRANTPMGHVGATYSSTDAQMAGNGPQMHSTAPQMPHGRPQQMPQQSFQKPPQQQYFQPPVGHQNGWSNHMQQQNDWQAENNYLKERQALLEQELKDLKQQQLVADKDREIAALRQQLKMEQNNATALPQMSNHSMPQGNWQAQQQSNWPPSQQGNAQPQSHGSASNNPDLLHQKFQQSQQWQNFPQQMCQPPMATPWMMPNQGMPSNGSAPRPTNMHGGYWQASPAAGHPMPMKFPQNGYPEPMNFSQSLQGAKVHGMYGGFNGGAGGDHAEESMPDFGY